MKTKDGHPIVVGKTYFMALGYECWVEHVRITRIDTELLGPDREPTIYAENEDGSKYRKHFPNPHDLYKSERAALSAMEDSLDSHLAIARRRIRELEQEGDEVPDTTTPASETERMAG